MKQVTTDSYHLKFDNKDEISFSHENQNIFGSSDEVLTHRSDPDFKGNKNSMPSDITLIS